MTSCDHSQKQIVDYFAGELPAAEREKIERHLESCETCRADYESYALIWQKVQAMPNEQPSHDLTVKFHAMLDAYQQGVDESRSQFRFSDWLRGAFARPCFQVAFSTVLLILGFIIGAAFKSGTEKLTYAKLSNELDDMRELVMLSMLKQQSSADRLQAVNYSYQIEQPRDDIREALQYTLEHDPNINVRLSALRALQPYAHDSQVRRQINDSFSHQQSPLVQVEIVDFIRQTETRPVEMLELLEQEDDLNDVVRQHIKWTVGSLQHTPLLKERKK